MKNDLNRYILGVITILILGISSLIVIHLQFEKRHEQAIEQLINRSTFVIEDHTKDIMRIHFPMKKHSDTLTFQIILR